MGRIDRGGGDGGEPARSPPIFRQSSLLNLDRWGCAVCLAADMAKTSIGVSGLRVMVEYSFQASISAHLRSPPFSAHINSRVRLAGTAR